MNEGRRRRSAKQGRRDAKRARTRRRTGSDEYTLDDIIGKALAKHPLHLLCLAAYAIATATPDEYAFAKSRRQDPVPLDEFVAGLASRRCRETTALLAVLAELLVDDDVLRDRCRQEASTRTDHLPKWIVGLRHVRAYRAVRRTDVLGDGDELAIGARLTDGTELTVVVYLDHNEFSSVKDIALQKESIRKVLARASERIDPDTRFVDMSLADARAWIADGVQWSDRLPQSDSWRETRPILAWLLAHLPAGGTAYQRPGADVEAVFQLLDSFFASEAGAPFRDAEYRDLLLDLSDTGSGDPLRWSAQRIALALESSCAGDHLALEIALDAPALLRAVVPFAHAQSGIRRELTEDTLAMIDTMSRRYKRTLLDDASEDYDIDLPPWRTYPNRAS